MSRTALTQHIQRQMAFSRQAYGPGERRKGICDHLMKEIDDELLPDHVTTADAADEFVDVVLLGLDGLWRAIAQTGVPWEEVPAVAAAMIEAKQAKNEQRTWPDWRTADPEKAIEHVRGHHD